MKRTLSIILTLLVTAAALKAQGKVSTRSHRLGDFCDKVTQVVLSGNSILSDALRQEVANCWTASAYELCTLEQFEKRKTSDSFYFLILLESRFKDEETPGVSFLNLLKGGPEAEKGIGAMFEVASLPLMAAMGGDGRELTYLGGLVKTIQEYTLAAMESENAAYRMENWVNKRFQHYGKMEQILIGQDDLASSMSDKDLQKLAGKDIHIQDGGQVTQAYLALTPNTLTGYVAAPVCPGKGSYCYKMLFDAETQSLYYISRHKIDGDKGVGFLPSDLKRLARSR